MFFINNRYRVICKNQIAKTRRTIVQVLQVCTVCRELRLQAVDVNGRHLSLPIEYRLRLIGKKGARRASFITISSRCLINYLAQLSLANPRGVNRHTQVPYLWSC